MGTVSRWYGGDVDAQWRVSQAWKDAPIANTEVLEMILETAREQVEAYAPAEFATERGEDGAMLNPPARYVYAQLQQAKNLWNAGRVMGNGEAGADGWSFVPRPLDKDIQRIIRPSSGVASVF